MKTYDIIIVGAGPGGLTAGIYAGRQGTKTLILDKGLAGGIGREVPLMENYPGFDTISGFELVEKMKLQCMKFVELHENEIVKNIEKNEDKFLVTTHKDEYCGKTIILATGSSHKHLEIPGEEEYLGKGVSYCATCDGMFFRDRNVAVAGGGNTALEDALFLSNYCKEVALIHRRDTFRGEQKMVEELQKKDNVTFFCNKKVIGLQSKGVLQGICLEDTKTGEKQELPVEGLFVAIGQEPENDRFIPLVDLDPKGYILAGEDCKTKTPGIFAAGDCRAKKVRQLATAASDGAVAALAACDYIGI